MKKIYSVLVENRSGVLCKVAGLFSRRAFNIDSLVVGETDDPSVSSISRELMLVKVKYNRNNRRDIMEICNILKAQIVDMSKYQMMIQICDVPDRVQLFLKMLNSISIVEVARTGTVALQKCHDQEN